MGMECSGKIRDIVKREIDESEPGITLEQLLERIDADHSEVISVIEELQDENEIKDDIVFWRGGGRHSSSFS